MVWLPGTTLQDGKYTLESKLGQGRFAITYLAKDRYGKELVIKTWDEDKLNQLTPGERNSLTNKFVNEGRKLERCKHAHVVSLLDTFMEGQLFCLAMEYIHGNTLESIVRVRKFLPEQEALGYIRQIAEALIEVHRQGLLHRDVKPENIIVRAGQHNAVLIDFDLADEFDHPLTSRFKDKGFAPIELNSSTRPHGSYTDIYSLAATLYFLLTGDLPASAMDRKFGTASLIPPKIINPLISEPVNHAILKGMELESDARPQTMEEWLELLEFKNISRKSLSSQFRGQERKLVNRLRNLWVKVNPFLRDSSETEPQELNQVNEPEQSIETTAPINTGRVWARGQQLQDGQYVIEEVLGLGGFGITYKALHIPLNQQVVIKTPNKHLKSDPDYDKYVARFIQEGQLLAQLSKDCHPNIVRLIDIFKEDETNCLVMDFIPGKNLYELVKERGAIPESEAVKSASQIGEALMWLHQAGLVHRDSHPGNIVLQKDGKAVLIDFGIAREIIPSTPSSKDNNEDKAGNLAFVPYEQIIKGSRQPTVDVYCLAATLYYAVTGQRPPTSLDRKFENVALTPPNRIIPSISDEVNQTIVQGMALEAEARPQSIEEWLSLLKASGVVTSLSVDPVETAVTYGVRLTVSPDKVLVGSELEVTIYMSTTGLTDSNAYLLELPRNEAIGSELNILVTAPGFQFDGDSTASLPLDPDTGSGISSQPSTQTATFRLTALRTGSANITAELYQEDTFKTNLETKIQVTGFNETSFTRTRITTQPRPVPQPDFILRVQTAWNESNSTCRFQYQLRSFRLPSLFPGETNYHSESLSSSWIEQMRGLLGTTLENISDALPEDGRSRLTSLGQYLFQHLLPTELQSDFRSLIPRDRTFTLLILADQDASLPWELLHDGQQFLSDRFIIGRWFWELNDTRPHEFPVGAINVAHYADVEQPELWTALLEPPGSPPPLPLPEGVLSNFDSTEAMRGLHLIRYSQSSDAANRRNAPVTLDDTNNAQDIERQMRPAKLNLRRNRPLVSLGYVRRDRPELTTLEQTWASAFIRAGCSAFTGSLWAVNPAVEAAFISGFYNRLWTGDSLGEAFHASRQLARAAAPDSLDWLAYVLFGDPMARPYRPVEGKGYAVVEPIGREIDDPLPPGVPVRFRLSLRRTPPVWHEERVIEVAENLTFENLQAHVKTFGLQVTPDSVIAMSLAPTGNYLGWFTLVAPPEMVGNSALVQVFLMDGMLPIHSLMFSLNIENEGS